MRNVFLKMIKISNGTLLLAALHWAIIELFVGAKEGLWMDTLIYIPIMIILSIAVKKAKYTWQYLLVAGILLMGIQYIGLPAASQNTVWILTLTASVSYFVSRAAKMKCWLDEPIYPFLALYLFVYILGTRSDSHVLEQYALIGAGVHYLLCIYYTNLEEIRKFVWINEKVDRVPVNRIYHGNYLMMGLQTILIVGGMSLCSFIQADQFFAKAGQLVQRVFQWLLGWLESDQLPEEVYEESTQAEIQFIQEAEEVSGFMEMIHQIMDWLGWVIAAAVTLYMLYRILKKLYQLYMEFDAQSEEVGDQIEKIESKEKEDQKWGIRKKTTERLFWDITPNARIRKYYKKTVLKKTADIPKASMTPSEIEAKLELEKAEKEKLRIFYEKARYGNVACTKEDVRNLLKE